MVLIINSTADVKYIALNAFDICDMARGSGRHLNIPRLSRRGGGVVAPSSLRSISTETFLTSI